MHADLADIRLWIGMTWLWEQMIDDLFSHTSSMPHVKHWLYSDMAVGITQAVGDRDSPSSPRNVIACIHTVLNAYLDCRVNFQAWICSCLLKGSRGYLWHLISQISVRRLNHVKWDFAHGSFGCLGHSCRLHLHDSQIEVEKISPFEQLICLIILHDEEHQYSIYNLLTRAVWNH